MNIKVKNQEVPRTARNKRIYTSSVSVISNSSNTTDWANTTETEVIIDKDVVATSFNVSALNTTPVSATDTGTTGEIRFTSDGIYICIATDNWIKCTGSTF